MNISDRLTVFAARGLGAGYAPKGPGTVGSIVGLAWFALLLQLPGPISYTTATVAGIVASIWICGEAERILQLKDPGSIVLDEIIALPICFLPAIWRQHAADGKLPSLSEIFLDQWILVVAVFVGFRVFDIFKPWPINQIQNLPGGWGVTADDVLAGLYVAAIVYLAGA